MTKDEMLEALISLKEKSGQFQTGSALYFYIKDNSEIRNILFELSRSLLEIKLGSCDSCYMDAYIKLAKMDMDSAINKLNCEYKLKDGVLLHLNGKPISKYNLTNELAKEYLTLYPEDADKFSIIPEDKPVIQEKKKVGRPKKK